MGIPTLDDYEAPPHVLNLILQTEFDHRMSGAFSTWSWDEFASILEMYSQRRITNHADTLDAFKGVMNHIRRSQPAIQFLCGLPFFRPSEKAFILSLEDLVTAALSWQSCPDGYNSPQRHTTFPSWAWAGWSGEVKFWRRNVLEARHQPYIRRARLESPSGQSVVSFANFKEDVQGELDTVTLIQFYAPTIPATSFSIDYGPDGRHVYQFSGSLAEIPKFMVSGRRLYRPHSPQIYSFEQLVENVRTGVWSCLTLCAGRCSPEDEEVVHSIFVLVVCWKADGLTAERIGSFCIHSALTDLLRLGPVLNGTWTWRRVRLV